MKIRTILWLVGVVLGAVASAQATALVMALVLGEPWLPFALPVAAGLLVAASIFLATRGEDLSLDHRSAFLAVTASWVAACVLGAGPFHLHPALELSVIDAVFESASGFTTTGATVLATLDSLPHSVLLWRSLIQWLGGMGIVLLGVAVFPILGLGGMQLFKAEAPGPTKDKITPRIAETAKLLWVLYLGLTLAQVVLLVLGGVSLFDAICHAMSTISTGGFSTHDASMGYWSSGFVHTVTAAFMLLGGMSFAVQHRALTQGISWSNQTELRAYLGIFTLAALFVSFNLRLGQPELYPSAAEALQHSVFQTASILTTTGFATQDFDTWPAFSRAVLFGLFFIGGMSGSTGGGIKVVRILVIARLAFAQFFRLIHPRGFGAIKLGDRTVEDQVVLSVMGFVSMYLALVLAGTLVLAFFGGDLFTSLCAVAVSLGNIGPGLAGVGPSHTFAGFEPVPKLLLAGLMILGRLEIYAALVILTPSFWRR